jgi:hypothetical protein
LLLCCSCCSAALAALLLCCFGELMYPSAAPAAFADAAPGDARGGGDDAAGSGLRPPGSTPHCSPCLMCAVCAYCGLSVSSHLLACFTTSPRWACVRC